MKMSEYTNKGHICECGENLIRDIADCCASFCVKCDGFFGKSK